MMNSIMALSELGYDLDHPLLRSQIEKFDRLILEDQETLRLQPCHSPVWDTAISGYAIGVSNSEPDERVAREDRRCLVELSVAGRTPATQVVVVHGRQVVVDQTEGVDTFDGGRHRPCRVTRSARDFTRADDEVGSKSFAGGEGGVAHGLGEALGDAGRWSKQFSESPVELAGELAQLLLDVNGRGGFVHDESAACHVHARAGMSCSLRAHSTVPTGWKPVPHKRKPVGGRCPPYSARPFPPAGSRCHTRGSPLVGGATLLQIGRAHV